jgi:hypothetical protein
MTYREMKHIPHPVTIQQQMEVAIQILKDWKSYDPIIAGNCLWAWASGVTANDVDIFIEEGWFRRRKLLKCYGSIEHLPEMDVETVQEGTYGEIHGTAKVSRFTTKVEGVNVDIHLLPWKSKDITKHFDYLHLLPYYGLRSMSTHGAQWYGGELKRTAARKHIRSENMMLEKRYSLWDDEEAFERMQHVMRSLNGIAFPPCM